MKINFVGDIGLFRKYEEMNLDPFTEMTLPDADLNIGNLEFVVPNNREKAFYDVQERYSCSYEYLAKLRINRFHGFGLANNHSMDYGLEGAQDTIQAVKAAGVQVFGFSSGPDYAVGSIESGGIRVGLIGCVKRGRWSKELYGYGPDSYDTDQITRLIKDLRAKYDHLVVYPHWGTELVIVPDPRDTLSAKEFIDAGASAVIGHHPHVSQGVERYRQGLIAYSLGSFIYVHEEELGYASKNPDRFMSMCINVDFDKKEIRETTCYYYKYNDINKMPENVTSSESARTYADFLNSSIYDQNLRKKLVRKVLLEREIISFWQRLKSSPIRTLGNYTLFVFRYLRNKFIPD